MDWTPLIVPGLAGGSLGFIGGLVGSWVLFWNNKQKIKADGENVIQGIKKDYKLQELNRDKEIALIRLHMEAEYDKDLRTRRIDAYKDLWKLFQKWENIKVTYNFEKSGDLEKDIKVMRTGLYDSRKELEDWYHQNGGIFLSEEGNNQYYHVLVGFIAIENKLFDDPTLDQGELRAELSSNFDKFRQEMVKDIGTNRVIKFTPQTAEQLDAKGYLKTP